MWKDIFKQPEVIKKCLNQNRQNVKAIVKKVREFNPNFIIIVARGTSDYISYYSKYLFEIYCHIPVALCLPSVITEYKSALNTEKALVIGISQSGASLDILEVIKSSKSQGSITIGVTNAPNSKLADTADYSLVCNVGMEKSGVNTKTFIAQMTLMTMLIAFISGNKQLIDKLDSLENAVEEALKLADKVEAYVLKYTFASECFFLARGISYALTMEAALKIQQTCYMRAKGYAIHDFILSHYSMVDSQIPCILFGVDKATNEDVLASIKRLNSDGIDTFVFTNNKECAALAKMSLLLPEWCEEVLGIFSVAVLAQMFACSLSVAKGYNPDAPMGFKRSVFPK